MDLLDRSDEVANVSRAGMLKCLVCGHDKFYEQISANKLAAALDLDTMKSRTSFVEICASCGHVHWFVTK